MAKRLLGESRLGKDLVWKYITSGLRSFNEMSPEYAKWHAFGEKACHEALLHMRDKEGWEVYIIGEAPRSQQRALREAHFDTYFVVPIKFGPLPDFEEDHDRISVVFNEDTNRYCAVLHSSWPFSFWYCLYALCFLRRNPELIESVDLDELEAPVLATARLYKGNLIVPSAARGTNRVSLKSETLKPYNKTALEIVTELERCLKRYEERAGDHQDCFRLGVAIRGEEKLLVNLRWFNIMEEHGFSC